jgi:hypothetical protein
MEVDLGRAVWRWSIDLETKVSDRRTNMISISTLMLMSSRVLCRSRHSV